MSSTTMVPPAHSSSTRPLIAIAADVSEPSPGRIRIQCALAYAACVDAAGGVPVFVPPLITQIDHQLAVFDGFVLTGGDDPDMTKFGVPTHPKATLMHPRRQAYETELITRLLKRPEIPVFGICLGMQLLSLVAGGKLDQHLPDHLESADQHRGDARHAIEPAAGSWLAPGAVTSHHRQAVIDAGRLRASAFSPDGVIEAVEHPAARFCLGVQWHPERTDDAELGAGLFNRFVAAAAAWRSERAGASALNSR